MTAIASLNFAIAPSLSPPRLAATPSSNSFLIAGDLGDFFLARPAGDAGSSLKFTSAVSPRRTRASNDCEPSFSFVAVTL